MYHISDILFITLICGVIWGAIFLSRRGRSTQSGDE